MDGINKASTHFWGDCSLFTKPHFIEDVATYLLKDFFPTGDWCSFAFLGLGFKSS